MTEQAAKIGRPKKARDEQRTERLSGIRLTTAERHHVEAMAAQAGLHVAEFCRRAILRVRIAAAPKAAGDDVAYELNRIGNNLNQIAKAAHLGKPLSAQLTDTLHQIQDAMRRLESDGS